MNRREIIALFAVAVCHARSPPLGAQGQRKVRIGYLNGAISTPEGRSFTGSLEILKERLQRLGWRCAKERPPPSSRMYGTAGGMAVTEMLTCGWK
jgi:hypothetical protein